MSAIFKTAPGTLIALRSQGDSAPTAGIVEIDGLRAGGQDCIITGFNKEAAAAAQARPTVGGPHYIYSFGQKLTQMQASLVVYPTNCDGNRDSYQNVWSFYTDNVIAPDKVVPIKLTFSGMTIYAFVQGMRTDVKSADGYPVIGVSITLMGWVDGSGVPSSAGSDPLGSSANADGGSSASPSSNYDSPSTLTPLAASGADSSNAAPASSGMLTPAPNNAQQQQNSALLYAQNQSQDLSAKGYSQTMITLITQQVTRPFSTVATPRNRRAD